MIIFLYLLTDDITGGCWKIGRDPKDDAGGLKTTAIELQRPPMTGWEYWTDTEWKDDPLIKVTGEYLSTLKI